MGKGKEKSNKEILQELENLRQQVAEFDIMKRQYAWTEKRLQESERRYRVFFEQAPDSIVLVDVKTGTLVEFNNKACEALGYTRKEFAKFKISDYEITESSEDIKKHLKMIADNDGDIFETRHKSKDGSVHNVLVSSRPVTIGEMTFVQSIWTDITAHKKSEQVLKEIGKVLQESQKFAKDILESSPYPTVVINSDASIKYINPALEKEVGFSSAEAIGTKPPYLWWTKKTIVKTNQDLKKALEKGVVFLAETFKRKNGENFYVEITSRAVKEKGKLKYYVASWANITERKKAEEMLKISEEKFRLIYETSSDAIMTLEPPKWMFTSGNLAIAKMFGVKNEKEFTSLTPWEVSPKYQPDGQLSTVKAKKVIEVAMEKGENYFEWTHRTVSGKDFFTTVLLNKVEIGGKALLQARVRDITERKRIEEELLITKYVFDNMADAAFWINPEGQIFYVNNAACNLLGHSRKELIAMKVFDIDLNFSPKTWSARWKEIKKDKVGKFETQYINKEGKKFPVEIHGKYMKDDGREYFCAIVRDVTERRRIEEAFRRAEEEKTTILDSLSEMVAYYGKDMRILWANKAAGVSSSLSSVALVGSRCYDIWHKRKVPCDNCPVVKVFKTGDYQEAEIALSDGRAWFVRAHPVKDLEGNVSGVVEVISDITAKKKIEQERKQSINKSRRILEETVIALAATAERRDPYTAGHQRRVAHLACAIAKEMNLDEDKIEGIRMASIIHDVGKVYVPAEMLSKPSELSELEFSIIKTHPQIGYDILKPVEFPWPIASIVLQHHERMDGSGYPRGIFSKDILIEAKILTVADVVEAMASYRPYRAALGIDKALAEIQKNKGVLYDEQVVNSCLRIFKKRQFKFE